MQSSIHFQIDIPFDIFDVSQLISLMFEIIFINEESLDPLMLQSLVKLFCNLADELTDYIYRNYLYAQKISYQARIIE